MPSITLTDLLIEKVKREEKYFKKYLKYAREIKNEAEKLLGEVQVFVFGSVLRKDEIPQDIDILIVSPKLETNEQKTKIKLKIQKNLGFSSPFEFHLASPEEYSQWYRYFIKEKVEI
jgi:predicted nucleotidyltransferase